ncbi:Uncharacterised protein [Klebsiella michiganensis]|nr:Uncharacterised protein [Klebsiella michiganensis]
MKTSIINGSEVSRLSVAIQRSLFLLHCKLVRVMSEKGSYLMQKKDNSIYDLIDIIKAVDKRAGSVNVLDSPLGCTVILINFTV